MSTRKEIQEKRETRLKALYAIIETYSNAGVKAHKTDIKEVFTLYDDCKQSSHDICPVIYSDVHAINSDPNFEKIIVYKDNVFWIANEQETKDFIANYMKKILPSLKRYWALVEKAGKAGYYDLTEDKFIAPFLEAK